MSQPIYRFLPMTAADLPQVRRWLVEPHVAEWWGNPDEQFELVSGDLCHPAMAQFVIEAAGSPIGYLQCYRMTDWNTGFGPQPEGTRGIDLFIAVPHMIGLGHGSALIRAFADNLLATGVPRVVTDPDPGNIRAIRAYANAGFKESGLVATPDGVALLMIRNPEPGSRLPAQKIPQ